MKLKDKQEIITEYLKIAGQFEPFYLIGFGGSRLFLINKSTLVPACSVFIGTDGSLVHENTAELTNQDMIMIDTLARQLDCEIEAMLMVYDSTVNQILLGPEAEQALTADSSNNLLN